jgi:putative ABC transport system substrate-binding protein
VRRIGLAVVLALIVLAYLTAGAQPPTGTQARIGVLVYLYPPDADPPQALSHHLHDLGYVEGQNVVLHWRYAQGRALAAELIRLKPDVIVADGPLAVRAAMQATSTIPIVMMGTADPVGGASSPTSHAPAET